MKPPAEDPLPFGLSWRQIYTILLVCHAVVILLFILFTRYYTA